MAAPSPKKLARLRVRLVIKWLGILLTFAALAGAGLFGWRGFNEWRTHRLVTKARNDFAQHNLRNAWLGASRALQLNPREVEAYRIMAEITALTGSRQEIGWRQQIVRLQPEVAENTFTLARTALRYGEIGVAKHALLSLPPAAKQSGAYYEQIAAVAVATHQLPVATAAYQQALALEPKNDTYALNLATLQLFNPDAAVRDQARAVIERSRAQPALRLPSLRALIADALNNGNPARAVTLARELRSLPDATFGDGLLLLNTLTRANPGEVPSALGQFKEQAVADPQNVGALLNWMNAHDLSAAAREWGATLPEPTKQTPGVALRLAEADLRLADWSGLATLTQGARWGEIEVFRLLFLCRALREKQQQAEAQMNWRSALAIAKTNPTLLPQVADMLTAWEWKSEVRDVLWLAADASKENGWALRGLYRDYLAAGDTASLLRVATKMAELEPANPKPQNDVAFLSLLLSRGARSTFSTDRALNSARELHEKNPSDPHYVSTYAFALHLHGRTEEALKIMQALRPEQLAEPGTALYYGVLLSAQGQAAEAVKYLDIAAGAPLLPEEKRLLEESRPPGVARQALP